ncbi:unnamed protein product [Rotaria sp. Silwood1]|nr:unnamed protein product [Rotaria sp. Silwood1]
MPSTHTIVSGDTLWLLSRKYGCTLKDILHVNPDIVPEQLQIGRIVYLPKSAATSISTSISTITSVTTATNQQKNTPIEGNNNNESIIVGYFTSWSIYQRKVFVNDISADKITHINYAFAKIGSDGEIERGDNETDTEKLFPDDTWNQPLRGNFNQLIKIKQKYPHLRTLISVGGWVCI